MGLKYLHSNNILHNNIKASNLLLTEKLEIKLGEPSFLNLCSLILSVDFGFASHLTRQCPKGKPLWTAPEVCGIIPTYLQLLLLGA